MRKLGFVSVWIQVKSDLVHNRRVMSPATRSTNEAISALLWVVSLRSAVSSSCSSVDASLFYTLCVGISKQADSSLMC